jgi:hypothetical protein
MRRNDFAAARFDFYCRCPLPTFPDSRRSQKRTVGKGSLARDRANKNPAMKAGSAGNVII